MSALRGGCSTSAILPRGLPSDMPTCRGAYRHVGFYISLPISTGRYRPARARTGTAWFRGELALRCQFEGANLRGRLDGTLRAAPSTQKDTGPQACSLPECPLPSPSRSGLAGRSAHAHSHRSGTSAAAEFQLSVAIFRSWLAAFVALAVLPRSLHGECCRVCCAFVTRLSRVCCASTCA